MTTAKEKKEESYPGLIETSYLTSLPDMKEKLTDGLNTPLEDAIPEEAVNW